jgi:hypothetical protein
MNKGNWALNKNGAKHESQTPLSTFPKFNISKSTHFSTFSNLLVSSIFIDLLRFPKISKIFLHKLTFKKDDLVKNE